MNTHACHIKAKLLWYNACETRWYGRGRWRHFELTGKGYGCLEDAEGNRYFVYGESLGGGLYGEDADVLFTKPGREYLITEYFTPDQPVTDGFDPLFMGFPRRVKTVTLLNGRKPSNVRFLREDAKAKAHGKVSRATRRDAS